MKRSTARGIAALLGAVSVVVGLMGLVFAGSRGGELAASEARWIVPLIAGGSVGVLAWLLLADPTTGSRTTDVRATVSCATCGVEVLEGWRLCPYCGGSTRPAADAPSVEPGANA